MERARLPSTRFYEAIELPHDWPRERIKELELATERSFCRRDDAIHALYRRARSDGKSVVFVSDMYLPAAAIAEILHDAGYTEYERLLVSSENQQVKGDGSQYRELLATLGVPAARVLHVGDNEAADVAAAAAEGITARHYAPPRPRVEAPLPRSPEDFAASVCHALVARHLRTAAADDDFWHSFGYQLGGSLLAGFTDWIRRSLVADGIDRVYFLARDGYVLLEAYERLRAAGRSGPPAQYVYASRRAFGIPSFERLDDEALDFLVASRPGLTVSRYLERAGIDPRAHHSAIVARGFGDDEVVKDSPRDRERLRGLFRDLEAPLLANMRDERALLVAYLRQLGMLDGGRIAIVDLGWNGTLQRALHRLFAAEKLDVDLRGYYLGTFATARRLSQQGHQLRSFVFEYGEPARWYEQCADGEEILEFLHLAPHGSVTRYRRGDDGIEPVLGPNDADAAKAAAAERAQQGALQFLDELLALWSQLPSLELSPECAFAPIGRLIADPTREEAVLLGELEHADGFGPAFVSFPIARPPVGATSSATPACSIASISARSGRADSSRVSTFDPSRIDPALRASGSGRALLPRGAAQPLSAHA